MNAHRILVVDDENLISWSLSVMLTRAGYVVETASSGAEALQKFREFRPELIMLDLNLPDAFGLDLLETMKGQDDNLPVLIITAGTQADLAVKAFRLGADQFFGKPFNMESIKSAVARALEEKQMNRDVDCAGRERRATVDHDRLIGNSSKMVEISKMIHVCASTDAKTVLITGESGTGKELVARAIHEHSARASGPFVEINCAAIPENLIENELFGHEKGAFTDASKKQKGIFELADGGTVFLDEIGDMPFSMQTKLLKVMETKRFRRLGGEGDVETDVRIVAATNQDLPRMVAEGKFRGDLYYRLNMMNICLPSLRERIEDVPSLVAYFIDRLNAEYGRQVERASDEALEAMLRYDWPGNVRELRNAVERAMMMEKGKVLTRFYLQKEPARINIAPELSADTTPTPADSSRLFAGFQLPPGGVSFEDVEKQLIALALEKANGNQSKAAKSLKMSRDTLRYRMKKFGFTETECDSQKELREKLLRVAESSNPTIMKWIAC